MTSEISRALTCQVLTDRWDGQEKHPGPSMHWEQQYDAQMPGPFMVKT